MTSGGLRGRVGGAYLASVVTFAQLAGIIAVADRSLLAHLCPALVAGRAALVAIAAFSFARHKPDIENTTVLLLTGRRPFGLRPALILAGVLTRALLVGRWVVDIIGSNATMLASGAAGLADAHAVALAAAALHR